MTAITLGSAIPQLPSGNIEVTEAFFVEKLGFEIGARYPEHKFLVVRRGKAEIHFWQAPDEESARKIAGDSSCYIRVENIQPLYEELRQRGASFRYGLEQKPWGMNEMQVDDPFGNAIRFGEQYK